MQFIYTICSSRITYRFDYLVCVEILGFYKESKHFKQYDIMRQFTISLKLFFL